MEEGQSCPLCEQAAPNAPGSKQIQLEIERADAQLSAVSKHTSGLAALVVEQEERIAESSRLLRENHSSLEAVRQSDERLQSLRDAAARRAHVLGRVSLFLETLPQVVDTSELRGEIEELKVRISQLEDELSDDHIQAALESILSVVGKRLTQWADHLDLEHGGNPFRLDIRKLQLVADTEGGPVPMDRMGSGANWLGCHLIAHLALHNWFVQKGRPVPRFLFLDQPSQVYFPAEQDPDGPLADLEDEDRLAVLRMFELIKDVVDDLGGEFQVVVTEHADLAEEWFQSAVVERWRDGAALIPADWIEEGEVS